MTIFICISENMREMLCLKKIVLDFPLLMFAFSGRRFFIARVIFLSKRLRCGGSGGIRERRDRSSNRIKPAAHTTIFGHGGLIVSHCVKRKA